MERGELLNNLFYVKRKIEEIIQYQTRQIELANSIWDYQAQLPSYSPLNGKNSIKNILKIIVKAIITLLVFLMLEACFGPSYDISFFLLLFIIVLYLIFRKAVIPLEMKILEKLNLKEKYEQRQNAPLIKFINKSWKIIAILAVLFFSVIGMIAMPSRSFTPFEKTMLFLSFIGSLTYSILKIVIITIKENKKIAQANAEINENNINTREHNAIVQSEYDEVTAVLKRLINELVNETSYWYPRDYYSLNAVDFFISSVQNFKTDSIKEAVLLFDDTHYKNEMLTSQSELIRLSNQQILNQEEMIRNQQAMIKQLKLSNVLNFGQLATRGAQVAATNRQTEQITSAMNNQTDAINSSLNKGVSTLKSAINKLK